MQVLGHEQIGTGLLNVMIMNDWMADTSTWDRARPYLDLDAFTWVFADLRGYGRSKAFEIIRRAAVLELLRPIAKDLTVVALSQCGHYPMQEMPPLTVATLEGFLRVPQTHRDGNGR